MIGRALAVLPGASGHSRLPALTRAGDVALAELAVLLLLGAAAAAANFYLRTPFRVPGSSILFTIFPLAAGVALVPRRGAGTTVSAAALASTGAALLGGVTSPGPGAITSMAITGPLLDLAIAGARSGWRLYGGFVLAALSANLLALAARAGTAALGLRPAGAGGHGGGGLATGIAASAGPGSGGGHGGGLHRGMGLGGGAFSGPWLRHALLTYAIAGVVAGLVSAVAWFHFRGRRAERAGA